MPRGRDVRPAQHSAFKPLCSDLLGADMFPLRAEGKAYCLMRAEQPEGFALQSCNAVLQFAPNSTVCALSSDVLCSDALAAAIAEDGKSIWELVREFEQCLTRHIRPRSDCLIAAKLPWQPPPLEGVRSMPAAGETVSSIQ